MERKAYVYRPGRPPEIRDNPAILSGEAVLPGFNPELEKIWELGF